MYKWVENKFRPYLEIAAGTRIKSTRKYSRTWAHSNGIGRMTTIGTCTVATSIAHAHSACYGKSLFFFLPLFASMWDSTGAGPSPKATENKFHSVNFVKCQFTSIERVAIEIVCKNSFKFRSFRSAIGELFSIFFTQHTRNSYIWWMLELDIAIIGIFAIVIVVIIESIFRLTRASHFVCYLLIAIARWSSLISLTFSRVRLAGNSVVYVIANFAAVFFFLVALTLDTPFYLNLFFSTSPLLCK